MMCYPTIAVSSCNETMHSVPPIASSTTIIKKRRVSFSQNFEVFDVERIDASLVQALFYQAADYKRFHEERQEERCKSVFALGSPTMITATIKTSTPSTVLDSLSSPTKHANHAGYQQRRQRTQRLVANSKRQQLRTPTAVPSRRSASGLQRQRKEGASQQLSLEVMRGLMVAASA